jgi:PKD repeat protein
MGNRRFLFDLAGLLIIAFLVTGAPAGAAVVTIDDTKSIQMAIDNLVGSPDLSDTLILNPGTYTQYGIVIKKDIIIRANTSYGGSATNTIIDATNSGRIFDNTGGHALTIDTLTLQKGRSNLGGAIYNTGGTVTITGSSITGCTATNGGAIYNTHNGFVTVQGSSTISDCGATNGGAIYNDGGPVTITSTTISGCTASDDGGAIRIYNGIVTITGSSITGCTATNGGAIGILHGIVTITGSTITGCSATEGGAIYSDRDGDIIIHFSRIYQNTATLGSGICAGFFTVDAVNNWWGTNEGPSAFITGLVYADPWLVLGIAADPASIDTAGTSAIRTNLTYNKTKTAGSQPVGDTSGMGHVPDRILNTFSLDPDSGSVLPPTDWTVNGVAQTTFIPESSGPAVIKATVDDQDVFLTIPVAQAPPVAGFFGTPASGPASLMVQFNDTSRYSPLMWNWSFGDGTWTNTTDLTKRNVSHRYSSIGTHTVSLTVSNAGGTDTHSETNYITVTDPVSPTTFSGTPRSGTAPLAVTFSRSSSGIPSQWNWSFGDGAWFNTTVSGDNPGHTYTTAGTYTVRLIVKDGAGTYTSMQPDYITVLPAPTPLPTTTSSTPAPTYSLSDSGDTLSDFPSSTFPPMTVIVNIGGDSKAWQAVVTGTKLSDLIVTGTVQSGPGGNFTAPPGIVYQYISLMPARYTSISNAVIHFTVPQSWLDENHIDPKSIVLYHQTANGWKALPTTVLYTKDGTVYFSAESAGFSLFAIAGTPTAATPPGVVVTQEILSTPVQEKAPALGAVIKAPITTQTTAPPAVTPQPAEPSPLLNFVLVIAVIGLLAGGGFMVRRWWIQRQNPALFREYD